MWTWRCSLQRSSGNSLMVHCNNALLASNSTFGAAVTLLTQRSYFWCIWQMAVQSRSACIGRSGITRSTSDLKFHFFRGSGFESQPSGWIFLNDPPVFFSFPAVRLGFVYTKGEPPFGHKGENERKKSLWGTLHTAPIFFICDNILPSLVPVMGRWSLLEISL